MSLLTLLTPNGAPPPVYVGGQVLVSGVFKTVTAESVLIGGAWKTVTLKQVCIGGAWKTLVGGGGPPAGDVTPDGFDFPNTTNPSSGAESPRNFDSMIQITGFDAAISMEVSFVLNGFASGSWQLYSQPGDRTGTAVYYGPYTGTQTISVAPGLWWQFLWNGDGGYTGPTFTLKNLSDGGVTLDTFQMIGTDS